MEKKKFLKPTVKVREVKPAELICGTGCNSVEIPKTAKSSAMWCEDDL